MLKCEDPFKFENNASVLKDAEKIIYTRKKTNRKKTPGLTANTGFFQLDLLPFRSFPNIAQTLEPITVHFV